MKLQAYLQLIHGGICPVCGERWTAVSELHHGVIVAQPCNHRLSMSMPYGFTGEKGPCSTSRLEKAERETRKHTGITVACDQNGKKNAALVCDSKEASYRGA